MLEMDRPAREDQARRNDPTTLPPTFTPVRPAPAFLPLRAILVLILLLLFLLTNVPIRSQAVLWITLVLAVVTLPLSYQLERRDLLEKGAYRWTIPVADLVLVILLHYGSCGSCSFFLPLFYVPIAYAGLQAGYTGSLVASLGAAGAYGILYATTPAEPDWRIPLSVILLFPLVGIVSGYLGRYFARLNAMGQGLVDQANRMYQELQQRRILYERWYRAVDRLKADFVYTASHELRTPLTPIKGYVQFLSSPDAPISEQKRKEYMQIVSNNITMLAQLVDDILYLQRVTRIPIDLEEVSLSEVAQQAVEEVAGEIEESEVTVEVEDRGDLPAVLGSRDSLKLVLANLLESAIRGSPAHSTIGLILRPLDHGVEVKVSGAGRGIPVEQQERIFDLFFHADSSPTYVLGQEGLSLAVARYIVEMHGGSITVENLPRGGTTFTVHLPGRP